MKEQFLKYLGSENDLNGYQKSYKLVLFKYFFEMMDEYGYAPAYEVTVAFKNFYVSRIKSGKIADLDVDDRIKNADNSSIREIYSIINQNPYNAINGQGYLSKEIKADGQGSSKDYFRLASELVAELTIDDITQIKTTVEKKLTLYFSKIDNIDSADLQSLFNQVMNGYIDAKRQLFTGNPIATTIRNSFPSEIFKTGFITPSEYVVTGSPGQGNWASVPWVGVFNKSITTSATKGVYIVYLFSSDCESVYLTFNQGCTELKNKFGKVKAIEAMHRLAEQTIATIDARGFSTGDHINLKDAHELPYLYERGTVFYKEYKKGQIPSTDILVSDLKKMSEIYNEYLSLKNENQYDWIPFYTELADKVLSYKNNRSKLMALMKDAYAACGLNYTYVEGDKTPLEDMCPFTFFGSFNKGLKDENRTSLLNFYKSKLNISADTPEKFDGIPVINSMMACFFAWKDKRKPDDIDNLWNVFESAILYSNRPTENTKAEFIKWFNIVKEQHCVKWNLTMGLYWIRPYDYLNLDERNRSYLKTDNTIVTLTDNAFDAIKSNVPDADTYLNYIDICKEKIFSQHEIIKDFPTLSYNAWLSKDEVEIGGEYEMLIKEIVDQTQKYIKAKGFTYEESLTENFYLSLKSKPFVILAGTSGTGKTKLVKLFAEAIGAEYLMVPVRPDWSDSSDLFGHLDLNGRFIEGAITRFVKSASLQPKKTYILCLDEMNLARVEYYFSDFLSVIETRSFENGSIISEPLVNTNIYGTSDARELFGEMRFPENLYVVGTVNMDETTFPFSRKVLDRANTIEFSYVNLLPSEFTGEEPLKLKDINNNFLKTEYLQLSQCEDKEYISNICDELQRINIILKKAEAHVGYRVRDEIAFYMLNNKKHALLPEDEAFDNEIMQKILPRIQGSSSTIKSMLIDLFQMCAGDYTGLSGSNTYEQMTNYILNNQCKYKKSANKIAFMIRRFEEDGFTSYWL